MIDVAIIEDQEVQRLGLMQVFAHEADINVVASEATVQDFLKRRVSTDVVLLDLWLPDSDVEGAEAVAHLKSKGHRVLVLSISDQEVPVVDAVRAGASGYLSKEALRTEVLRAVRRVAQGDDYISPTLAGFLLSRAQLAPRERDVLALIAEGATASEIAQTLHIAEATVNGTITRIRTKSDVRNKAELTREAYRRGLINVFVKKNRREKQ